MDIESAFQYRADNLKTLNRENERDLFSVLVFKNDKTNLPKHRNISAISGFQQTREKYTHQFSDCVRIIRASKKPIERQRVSINNPVVIVNQSKQSKHPLSTLQSITLYEKPSIAKIKCTSVSEATTLLCQLSIQPTRNIDQSDIKSLFFKQSSKQPTNISLENQKSLFIQEHMDQIKPKITFASQNVFSFEQTKAPKSTELSSTHSLMLQQHQSANIKVPGQSKMSSEEETAQFSFSNCTCDCARAASKLEVENKKLTAIYYIRELNLKSELIRMRKKIDGFKSEPSISHTLKEINQRLTNEKQALEAKLMILMTDKPDLSDRFNREVERDNLNMQSLLSTAEDKISKLEKKFLKSKKRQAKLNSKLEGILPLMKIMTEQVFLQNANSFASVFDACASKKIFDTEVEQLTKYILLALENARRADRSLSSPNGVLKASRSLQEASSAWLLVISEKQRNIKLSREKKELRDIIAERVI